MSEQDEKLLYQYTNIEALASILKNRTIRLDDLQEQMSADLKNAAKFVFISSWTKSQDESISMWKLYTSLKKGVRIGLPFCPFEKHPPTETEAGKVIYNNDFKGTPATDTYLGWEVNLLRELGYALDLHACAGCGATDNLTHLSPRTCRAVCEKCAAPYADRLYSLP